MKASGALQNIDTVDYSDRNLTMRITAILTGLAIAVIAAAIYAGFAMNASALGIESGILEKDIDRIVVKTLDEQKSVALWDEAVVRIAKHDIAWMEVEIGTYMTGTYGHDQVIVVDSKGDVIYEHDRQPKPGAVDRVLAAAKPLLEEIRGNAPRGWTKRDGQFVSQQVSQQQLVGASQLRAGGNLLRLSDEAAIVTAMTVMPTHNIGLLGRDPPVIVSVLYLTPDRLLSIGEDVNVKNLHLIKRGADQSNGLITLIADDGKPIGALTWVPQHPGKAFLTVLLPALLIVTLAGVLSGRFLVVRTTRLADRLRLHAANAHRLAFEDPVTGLPNRRAFYQLLEERCSEWTGPFVVTLVDIDRFKEVNDTYGHETGDRLIEAVASRLNEEIGDQGLVARLGGDEFAVLAPLDSSVTAQSIKKRLGTLFNTPFQLGPYRIISSTSMGLYVVQDPDSKPETVLRNADTALYEAKSRGRRQGVIFSPQMSSAARARRLIEKDLQEAIETEQLYVEYQPLQSHQSGSTPEVEALIRWRHPQLGELSPDSFIPIAEQSNLIVLLGQKIFEIVLRQLGEWPDLHVSINISPRELRSNEFLRFVRNACREYGVAANRITLEVTEGIAIDDSGKVNLILQSLRAIGFRIALDDFGTGYASLSFLRTYPLDRVKLDRSLMMDVGSDIAATAVFLGAVTIGRQLGLEVVAEGIEAHHQLITAKVAGCTHAQGYLVSPPLTADKIADFFNFPRIAQSRKQAK